MDGISLYCLDFRPSSQAVLSRGYGVRIMKICKYLTRCKDCKESSSCKSDNDVRGCCGHPTYWGMQGCWCSEYCENLCEQKEVMELK